MSAKRSSINACLPCRKVKMRCVTTGENSGRCDRCTRKSLQCIFREHCRGRKPGMRVSRKGERKSESGKGAESWTESDGFQPHSLFNHQATRGKFSLENILSVDHRASEDRMSNTAPIPPDDPIVLGLINTQVASCLLDYFMQKINPYISQLDPALHTFHHLRSSPFLMTAVLAAAAKAFESALYPTLYAHAERLFLDVFRRGDKSTEIVQAILILTYWKQPNDTRAWTSVGLAIRIAMDLGWHKLSPRASHKEGLSELERREIRNVERTFLVLFVYDRSLSLQTGKPWMIEHNELLGSAEDWWRDGLSNPNDRLLCAFVALRLLTADTFDLLIPSKTNTHPHLERHLTVLDRRIEHWERKWLDIVSRDNSHSHCHVFMVEFYGLHARLQLFSMPLQTVRLHEVEKTNDLKPFWSSYNSALAMFELINRSSALLYLAQDSIHVMTAYAAIFLIKLLLTGPPTMIEDIESPATQAISEAASIFAGLSAPANSSCALQALFLEKTLLEYARVRNSRLERRARQPVSSSAHVRHSHGLRNQDTNAQRRSMSPSGTASDIQSSVAQDPQVLYEPCQNQHVMASTVCVGDHPRGGFTLLYEDENIWDEMFNNAGFSIEDGIFFG